MKIVALAGGVGGARLSDGLARLLPAGNLTVVVNVGDDFEHLGLKISPDLDTVCYTLAGIANLRFGWGRDRETYKALETIHTLGGPDWFKLGDRDIGLHLLRTQWLALGRTLSQFCKLITEKWNIPHFILPVTDTAVKTIVHTAEKGSLPFQDYFVKEGFQPTVTGFSFEGVERSLPAPGVLEAIDQCDAVVICPSNPWVSIDPILAIPGIRGALREKPMVGVSPIIGGRTIKGPAAKMFRELQIDPSPFSVAYHYKDMLQGFLIDSTDAKWAKEIHILGIIAEPRDIIMRGIRGRKRLAREVLALCSRLMKK